MNCRLARKSISRYLDGTLDAERLSALQRHLGSCADCRALLADLRKIAVQAKNLEPLDPPDRVWFKIRAGLRERRAAATERPGLVPGPLRPRFGFRFALASAAALLVVAGGLVVFQPWKPGAAPLKAEQAALNKRTLDKLNEAEWHYHEAIRALREAVESQGGSLDPGLAAVFAANLGVVDASIEACRQAVLNDPRDLGARNALLASYGQKVQILNEWVSAQKAVASESRSPVRL